MIRLHAGLLHALRVDEVTCREADRSTLLSRCRCDDIKLLLEHDWRVTKWCNISCYSSLCWRSVGLCLFRRKSTTSLCVLLKLSTR